MKLLNKRRIIKSLQYYLGEIAVVVIGIFIAFQLNNYNEQMKNSNEEKNSLKRLLSDLKTEKSFIEKEKNQLNRKKTILKDFIYNNEKKNLDSLFFYIAHQYIQYDFGTEYSNLKFSGKLNIIKNDSLRYYLVNYYELSYSFYNILSKDHQNFVVNEILVYTDKIFESDSTYLYNPKVVEQKLKERKLNKLIKSQILYYDLLNQRIKVNRIDRLMKLVETDL